MINNTGFYKKLSYNNIPIRELLKNENLFNAVPSNWVVIVTDIVNSTKAIKNGGHNDVNLVATGSIITVLNKIKKINKKITIPYFFGGDGATFIVAKEILEPVYTALENYSDHVEKNFNLKLRVGQMRVEDIYATGATLRIAKLKLNSFLVTPVIIGNGFKTCRKPH